MTTEHDHFDIPELQPRRTPTRYTRGLTREARLRLGLEREPINWGDLVVAIVVVGALAIAVYHITGAA